MRRQVLVTQVRKAGLTASEIMGKPQQSALLFTLAVAVTSCFYKLHRRSMGAHEASVGPHADATRAENLDDQAAKAVRAAPPRHTDRQTCNDSWERACSLLCNCTMLVHLRRPARCRPASSAALSRSERTPQSANAAVTVRSLAAVLTPGCASTAPSARRWRAVTPLLRSAASTSAEDDSGGCRASTNAASSSAGGGAASRRATGCSGAGRRSVTGPRSLDAGFVPAASASSAGSRGKLSALSGTPRLRSALSTARAASTSDP